MRRPQIDPAGIALARAVLLFHSAGAWVDEKEAEWLRLTGTREATTRTLCNLARKLLAKARKDDSSLSDPSGDPAALPAHLPALRPGSPQDGVCPPAGTDTPWSG